MHRWKNPRIYYTSDRNRACVKVSGVIELDIFGVSVHSKRLNVLVLLVLNPRHKLYKVRCVDGGVAFVLVFTAPHTVLVPQFCTYDHTIRR